MELIYAGRFPVLIPLADAADTKELNFSPKDLKLSPIALKLSLVGLIFDCEMLELDRPRVVVVLFILLMLLLLSLVPCELFLR